MTRVTWSEAQKTLLRKRFKTTCDADLAQLVGLPQVKVYHQLRRMELVRVALAYNDEELLALYRSTVAQGTSNFPARFFTGDVGLERLSRLVRVVLTEVAKIAIDDLPHRLSADLLGELGLAAPLAKYVGQSPYKSANLAWPDRWNPWDFGIVPNGYWSGRNGKEHAKEAIHWLVEVRLGLQPEELPTMQLDALFNTNGLGGALVAFGGSAIAAIVYAYPQFRAYDFKGARYDVERREHIVQRIARMFEGMLPDEIPKNASKKLFRKHGLSNDLAKLFGGSPWAALEAAFPGRYQKWQVSDARHIWSGEQRIENVTSATRWLVETKLGLEPSAAPQVLKQENFVDAGLAGMLNGCPELSKSYVRAFQLAYPGVAHIWEFRYTPRGTFRGAKGRETAVEAVRWMVAKLGVEPAELSGLITREHFANAGLLNMLDPVFGGSCQWTGKVIAV